MTPCRTGSNGQSSGRLGYQASADFSAARQRPDIARLKLVPGGRVDARVKMLGLALAWRKTATRAFGALIDGRVPLHLKLFAVAASVFVLSPLNLLGDIPLLGTIDDAGLLTLVMLWFTRASTPYQNTIDI